MYKEKMTRAWAEIDLDAIAHNIKEVQKCVDKHTMIMGVVKANAYGHGAVEVAKTLLECGVNRLAVAEIHEAEELREAKISVPILILGASDIYDIPLIIKNNVMSAVFSYGFAKALSDESVKCGKISDIHIKIDSGMSRIGYVGTDEEIDEIIKISQLPGIRIEGMFSHFACADMGKEADERTKKQFDKFMEIAEKLEKRGLYIPVKHIANSATIARYPGYHLDMVRAGIVTYGYAPSDDYDFKMDLIPAMTLKSKITRLHMTEDETPVSYGFTYVCDKKSRIATVPIGYADGYFRSLSGKVQMTAGGKNVPVIGRICMDQCMIEVNSVNNINVGDEVIVFGNGKNSSITADSLAKLANTISYEIISTVGKRIPRVFIKNGTKW